ncbi:MAG TPA: HEAT repeat domain-containing protein [Lacipirellulaceae bacterium]|nr:HEAT repeat domain-containing protein [Lacipirellulaceae bacterium]
MPHRITASHLPTCSRGLRTAVAPLARGAAVLVLLAGAGALPGCQVWPFRDNERTSIITPAMRAATIREFGPRGRDASESEQIAMCEELAQQIRTEPDPICRRAIQETIAEFKTPLAGAVLVAGLSDDDRDVRTVCCRMLAQRKDESAVGPLSRVVAADPEMEVRMAAIDALGQYDTPAAVQGLAAAIKDRDPALQYAGVQAMKNASGQDLGNDVEAWRSYAASLTPAGTPGAGAETSIATQPGGQNAVR